MKRCPACQTVYEDRVDFCFEDGSPLEEHDAGPDPTALPSGLDAPERPTQPAAAAAEPASKKPRGRGMFARPSVADMLALPEPGVVPPAGGHRVAVAPVTPELTEAVVEEPPESDASALPVSDDASAIDPEADTLIYERDTISDELDDPDDVEEPASIAMELPDLTAVPPSIDVPPAAIDVPVSAEAVEVPATNDEVDDSFDSPPGLEEPAAVSLDDTWFGGDDEFDVPGAAPEEAAADPIEDPGFADVTETAEIGFVDTPWSADGSAVSSTSDGGLPKGVLIGGFFAVAAVIAATVLLSGGDDSTVQGPAVQPPPVVQTVPPPPPPPPPVPAEPEAEEGAGEDVEGDAADADSVELDAEGAEGGEEVDAVEPPVEEERTESEIPAVVPVAPPVKEKPPVKEPAKARAAPVVPPARTAKAAKAAKASTPKVAKAAKAAPQTPWTGASTPAASPPKPAASSNPWGAPVETASRGRMTITTEPAGAMVYVDGRRIGKSPTRTEVTYGTHKVRIELSNHKTSSRVVNVQVAEVAVPFRLETATMMGRCNLLGPMGSSVSMDGRNVGRVPTTVACSPGGHRFKVTPKDGAPFTVSKTVVIASPGESVAVQLFPG